MQRIEGLFVMKSEIAGRGVFTAEKIHKGDLIEICPVIIIPRSEVDTIHQTELHDYYFVWGENNQEAAIALGFGSIYNHSYNPNAEFILDLANSNIDFYSIQDIEPGTEITVNYHGDPECLDDLWFDHHGNRVKRIKPFG
ncbi:MAG: SET domain-containing protein-lysine N-methyltransferase [Saprospiraceae bacterium]|nr:SET domain-containing protein-lysine N-methyltransferase [Saprospiraceae bacterium]MBK9631054.1 SET domain-containing protein-lysine N-methyltransferase [Saprospiraceae bacterium]